MFWITRLPALLLSLLIVFFLLPVCQLAQAQIDLPQAQTSSTEHIVPRVIWKAKGNISYPIGTLSIFYDGKPIKPGIPFKAPDDWLKHISVSFENRSAQTLIAGALQLDFRELGDPLLFYDVRFGVLTEHQLYAPSGKRIPRPPDETAISVAPGAIATVPFETSYSSLRSTIEERTPLAQVTTCWISYGFFYFDKDLRWGIGSFTRAHPSILGKYIPAAPEDFMPKPQTDR